MVQLLEVIDDNNNVLRTASREEVFGEGLLHRSVQVLFITPGKDIIYQRRSSTKLTFPSLLDVTVCGGVEVGDSYDETVLKETFEETGQALSLQDMTYFGMKKLLFRDKKHISHSLRATYGYIFHGNLKDLKIEKDNGEGFEKFPLASLINLSPQQKSRFIPELLQEQYVPIYKSLANCLYG